MSLSKTQVRQFFSLYTGKEQLCLHRCNTNMKYLKSLKNPHNYIYLTPEEELTIVKMYEFKMRDFLQGFHPRNESLPKEIKGVSFHYLKRFYIVSSVMDYHPKDMMFACVFLACKNFEYNLPLDVFVKHIGGEQTLMRNIILDCEEALLCRLNFLLHIHTPHKPIKQYINQLEPIGDLINPQLLYEHVNHFMANMWFSDVCLLFPPQKIALAAIIYATDSIRPNIDNIIMTNLLPNCRQDHLSSVAVAMRSECNEIRAMVTREKGILSRQELNNLEIKLEKCLNPRNNPVSDTYRTILMGK